MTDLIIDLAGWLGAIILLLAYALVSGKKLDGAGVPYQLLNLSGSGLLAANSIYHGAIPSVFVNVVWILIGLVAILNSRRKASQNKGSN
jgi:hypothetical protein